MSRLAQAIGLNSARNEKVMDLHLVGLQIGKQGWEQLGSGLSRNHSIQEIVINFCKLRDDGVAHLAKGIN